MYNKTKERNKKVLEHAGTRRQQVDSTNEM